MSVFNQKSSIPKQFAAQLQKKRTIDEVSSSSEPPQEAAKIQKLDDETALATTNSSGTVSDQSSVQTTVVHQLSTSDKDETKEQQQVTNNTNGTNVIVSLVKELTSVQSFLNWKDLTKERLRAILTLSKKQSYKNNKGETVWVSVNMSALHKELPHQQFELDQNRLSWFTPHGRIPLGCTLNQSRNKWQMQLDCAGSADPDMDSYKLWSVDVLHSVLLDLAEEHKDWFPDKEPEKINREWLEEKADDNGKNGHYRKERNKKKLNKEGVMEEVKVGNCFKISLPHKANGSNIEDAELIPPLFRYDKNEIHLIAANSNSLKPQGKKVDSKGQTVDDKFVRTYGSVHVQLRNIWFVAGRFNWKIDAFQIIEMPDVEKKVNSRGVVLDAKVAPQNLPVWKS